MVRKVLESGASADGGAYYTKVGILGMHRILLGRGSGFVQGSTPLIAATIGNRHKCMTLLLEAGANPEVVCCSMRTALSYASEVGHVTAVTILLKHGADAHGHWASICGTPLMTAAANGRVDVARELLSFGAQPDLGVLDERCPSHQRHPLTPAIGNGHLAMVKLLLAYGARRDLTEADELVPDEWGGPAEWEGTHAPATHAGERYALYVGQPALLQLLRETRGFSALHFLNDADVLSAARTSELLHDGASPFVRAATSGAPSPLDLARRLECDGKATAGSPAALVLCWWRARLTALAQGTHSRLGQHSPLRHLCGMREIFELIAVHVAE